MDVVREQTETPVTEYPLYISERNKKWFDLLKDAVEKKFIWNVDFKGTKFLLGRNFEEIGYVNYSRGKQLPGDNFTQVTAKYAGIPESEVWRTQYGISRGTHQDFQSINKLIRIFEEAAKSSKVAQKYLEVYKSWKVVKDLFDAVKPFITKGHKPDLTKPPKPVYQPPRQSTKVLGEIKTLLDNLIEKHKEELKQSYVDMVNRMADMFVKERTVDKSNPSKFFKYHSAITGLIGSLFEFDEKRDPWDYEWHKNGQVVKIKYRNDANEKVEKFAEANANAAAEAFVINNMKKLTAVIGEKTKGGIVLTSKEVNGSFGVSFSGRMYFKFSDGTSFQTRNDITLNVSPRGLIFNQFPITFHNVIFKNGKAVKFVSEKAMNEVWAKEQ